MHGRDLSLLFVVTKTGRIKGNRNLNLEALRVRPPVRHTFQWGERTYCVTWPSWTGTELWNLKVRVQRGAYQAFVFKLSSMFWIYYGYKYISTNRYFAIKRWIAVSVNTLYNQIRMRVFLSLLHVSYFFIPEF